MSECSCLLFEFAVTKDFERKEVIVSLKVSNAELPALPDFCGIKRLVVQDARRILFLINLLCKYSQSYRVKHYILVDSVAGFCSLPLRIKAVIMPIISLSVTPRSYAVQLSPSMS